MKTKQEEALAFDDLVAATYKVWGQELAAKMVCWAIKTRRVKFQDPPLFSAIMNKRSA
jgi:hypothetical protein